jgi:hypothetical protein
MDQHDRTGLMAAKPVFTWHAKHEDLYTGQRNAGRVLLLTAGDTASYRGFFRLLSEQHVPFVVSSNLRPLEDPAHRIDLVIPAGNPPEGLERYVREGGRLLVAGTTPPAFAAPPVSGRRRTQGYWRIHDRTGLPSLRDTDLLFLDGEYAELAPLARPLLTLNPTAMFGPPEKVWSDTVESVSLKLVWRNRIGLRIHQRASSAAFDGVRAPGAAAKQTSARPMARTGGRRRLGKARTERACHEKTEAGTASIRIEKRPVGPRSSRSRPFPHPSGQTSRRIAVLHPAARRGWRPWRMRNRPTNTND